jgi:hypothetical protein
MLKSCDKITIEEFITNLEDTLDYLIELEVNKTGHFKVKDIKDYTLWQFTGSFDLLDFLDPQSFHLHILRYF